MARRWIVAGILVLIVAGTAIAVAIAPGSDSGNGGSAALGSTTSSSPVASTTTTVPTSSTAAPTTTAPPTTTAAAAVPGACGTDAGPIQAAIDAGVSGASSGAQIAECRLASSDPQWALVALTPRAGSSFNAVNVVLHGGAGSWSIVATGGTGAGCGKAPQQVIADLGQFCVGTGGGQ
jgi:hypothetical protein